MIFPFLSSSNRSRSLVPVIYRSSILRKGSCSKFPILFGFTSYRRSISKMEYLGVDCIHFPVFTANVFPSISNRFGDAEFLFRPYNARLTREAVAPFWPAWKGRAEGGSGATFAVRPNLKTQRAKGVTATLSRVESIVIRRTIKGGL
jgi:hypothetical protein